MNEWVIQKQSPVGRYIEALRIDALAQDQENESLRLQRNEFCRLLEKECSFTQEEAENSYDIRRVLMHVQSKFDLTLELGRNDFFTLLSVGKDMLYDEGRAKVLSFIIRRQRLARPEYSKGKKRSPDFRTIAIHPYVYFSELLPCRFVAFDELLAPYERAYDDGETSTHRIDDLNKILDFCATIHTLNTAYYNTYPKMGVPEEGVSQNEHIRQKRGEANHLVIWRGLPYQILSTLIEADVLKNLPAQQRVRRVEEIARMCLHEYFNLSFFHPHILEKPPQIAHAAQLLRSLVARYGDDPFLRGGLDRALEREMPRFDPDQLAYVQAIYNSDEPLLTLDQLMRVEEIVKDKEES